MFFLARLYASQQQASDAVAALTEVGYSPDSMAMLTSSPAVSSPVEGSSYEGAPSAPAAPATGNGDDRAMAVRAGKFMGEHAEFYVSRVTDGACLVVAAPPFMASARAEQILDDYDPLPDSHLPPPTPYVPISEQATPFSDMLGWPTLTSGTPFSDALGFSSKQAGLSHLSRVFPPLLKDFTAFPMSTKARKDTIFPMSTRSDRLEGKSRSFGMGFSSKTGTPFSSMFGMPLLTKRKFFMS